MRTVQQQTGAGRGDPDTVDSALFIIQRDPFRSIRRGRQLFQRNSGGLMGKDRGKATAQAISIPTAPSALAWPIAVRPAMDAREGRQAWEAMSPPGRTAAIHRTSSGWD